jgi:hypothetical protein
MDTQLQPFSTRFSWEWFTLFRYVTELFPLIQSQIGLIRMEIRGEIRFAKPKRSAYWRARLIRLAEATANVPAE